MAWTAPAGIGGSAIVEYDLRYIETGAPDKADANWTLQDAAWTSGPLEYQLSGLTGEVSYDVQVRAVNGDGDGAWSATTTGSPLVGRPSIFSLNRRGEHAHRLLEPASARRRGRGGLL